MKEKVVRGREPQCSPTALHLVSLDSAQMATVKRALSHFSAKVQVCTNRVPQRRGTLLADVIDSNHCSLQGSPVQGELARSA